MTTTTPTMTIVPDRPNGHCETDFCSFILLLDTVNYAQPSALEARSLIPALVTSNSTLDSWDNSPTPKMTCCDVCSSNADIP